MWYNSQSLCVESLWFKTVFAVIYIYIYIYREREREREWEREREREREGERVKERDFILIFLNITGYHWWILKISLKPIYKTGFKNEFL